MLRVFRCLLSITHAVILNCGASLNLVVSITVCVCVDCPYAQSFPKHIGSFGQ